MISTQSVQELRQSWLPNITDSGLDRLIELLEKGSPLLLHGCFSRAIPMGCLATHIAWHHPRTSHLMTDAGVNWLHFVAHLNPATSSVIAEWDRAGPFDFDLRMDLLGFFVQERQTRRARVTSWPVDVPHCSGEPTSPCCRAF